MTPETMVYVDISMVHRVYKPTYSWGAHLLGIGK